MSNSWSLAPYLRTENAAEAIAWYIRALGATETARYEMPDGTIGHAELDVHGNRLCLADTNRAGQFTRPQDYGQVPILTLRRSSGRRCSLRPCGRSGRTSRAFAYGSRATASEARALSIHTDTCGISQLQSLRVRHPAGDRHC